MCSGHPAPQISTENDELPLKIVLLYHLSMLPNPGLVFSFCFSIQVFSTSVLLMFFGLHNYW